eukprot:NODE_257_length_11653_cov_0.298858.p2 type:complete len:648 gc:universal NODE_257_length_11653_cov_0.298858:4236-6179(+)
MLVISLVYSTIASECTALGSLATSLGVSGYDIPTCCTLKGISCNIGNTSITSIQFSRMGLNGSFPGAFPSNLPSLTTLNVSHNLIYGFIPNTIPSYWAVFTSLDVSYNRLSGPLPYNVPISMSVLLANDNLLSGMIISLDCKTTNVANNHFSGQLPPMSNVIKFYGANNFFSGSLPAITNVQILDVRNNQLVGSIGINNLNMQIDVSMNRLTGISFISPNGAYQLNSLNVSKNMISNMALVPNNVKILDVSYNLLTKVFTLPGNITTFIANNNVFSGSLISTVFLSLKSINYLDVSNNLFNGSFPNIPSTITYLDISNNSFSGDFPVLPLNLQYLDVSTNLLRGLPKLPSTLTYLNASHDLLSGSIEILSNVATVDVSFNGFNRILNVTVATTYLDASNNQFTSIFVKNATQLTFCNLTNNPKLGGDFSNLNACIFNTSQPLLNMISTKTTVTGSVQFNFITSSIQIAISSTTQISVKSVKFTATNTFTTSTVTSLLYKMSSTNTIAIIPLQTSIITESSDLSTNQFISEIISEINSEINPSAILQDIKIIKTRIIYKTSIPMAIPSNLFQSTPFTTKLTNSSVFTISTIPIKPSQFIPNLSQSSFNAFMIIKMACDVILLLVILKKVPKHLLMKKKVASSKFDTWK